MAKVYYFCQLYKYNNNRKYQEYIRDYFREETPDNKLMKNFCEYVKKFVDKDAKIPTRYVMPTNNDKDIKELLSIMKDVNEIRINNTKIANALRHHPEAFVKIDGCMVYESDVTEWKAKKKEGSEAAQGRSRTVKMILHTEKIPDYLDMCIMDAIYSIEMNHSNRIYTKTIWEILSGSHDVRFSRANSKIKTTIESRIEALRDIRISIYDEKKQFRCEEEIFLPLTVTAGEKGYRYRDIPPLYRYAEETGGEITKLPVVLMDCRRASQPVVFRSTIANMVLTHYLLHRISIYRYSRRERYIRFSTVYNICLPYLPDSAKSKPEDLQRKIAALMCFWSQIPEYCFQSRRKFINYQEKNQKTACADYDGIVLCPPQGHAKPKVNDNDQSQEEIPDE